MTELETLDAQIDSLVENFRELDLVKQYHALKKALEEDASLNELQQKRKKLQSSLRFFSGNTYTEALNTCKQLQKEYESSPLYVNFMTCKEEVLKLIEPLTETKL